MHALTRFCIYLHTKYNTAMIKNRLVLIDAFALIHRAFHAIPPLATADGRLVNAVYGFTGALLSAIKELQPEYLAVGIDLPKPTRRKKEYAAYKAHRVPPPDELKSQIPYVMEMLKIFNIPVFGVEGYEGEDIIATVVAKIKMQKSKCKNIEFIIVTGDLDLLQLIDDQTKVYAMGRGANEAIIYDKQKVIERYSLKPEQFVDFKALKGDVSDNIPWVRQIWEKTAAKLMTDFGSLKNIYENLEKISGKSHTLLSENKEQAFLSQKLSKISTDAPLEFRLEDARIHEYNKADVIRFFNQLGFKSLISRLPSEIPNHRQEKLL